MAFKSNHKGLVSLEINPTTDATPRARLGSAPCFNMHMKSSGSCSSLRKDTNPLATHLALRFWFDVLRVAGRIPQLIGPFGGNQGGYVEKGLELKQGNKANRRQNKPSQAKQARPTLPNLNQANVPAETEAKIVSSGDSIHRIFGESTCLKGPIRLRESIPFLQWLHRGYFHVSRVGWGNVDPI